MKVDKKGGRRSMEWVWVVMLIVQLIDKFCLNSLYKFLMYGIGYIERCGTIRCQLK